LPLEREVKLALLRTDVPYSQHNANSPAYVLPANPHAWKLRIFLGAGTKDQPYYADTQQFILELNALHLDYSSNLKNGYHTCSIWEAQLYHALIWLQWRETVSLTICQTCVG